MVNINRPFFLHLVGYFKAFKLPGIISPIHFDLIDTGHPRPLAAPIQGRINILLAAFKNSFDRTVAFVPHPSENAKPCGGTLCFHPKKHSLNPSGYDGMGPDLFFHANLLALRAAWDKSLGAKRKRVFPLLSQGSVKGSRSPS
jgi:hypothetical protein